MLLAGVRDEFADRPWQPPAWHWPEFPGLIGGLDREAGGTWLAVAPAARRAACVLNARGRAAPAESRRSRGVLPLRAAAGRRLGRAKLSDFDPFHLVRVEPGSAVLSSWDGERLTERELAAGLHIVVNSGLNAAAPAEATGTGQPGRRAGSGEPAAEPTGPAAADGRDHELARVAHFGPLLRAAARPDPRPGDTVEQAWGDWLPLLNGGGIASRDPRALIVRRDLGHCRIWGTTSISLVALRADGLRYDFTGMPGDPAAWHEITLDATARPVP